MLKPIQRNIAIDEARFKVWDTGRRSGKSYLVSYYSQYLCASKPNQFIYIVEPSYKMAKKLILPEIIKINKTYKTGLRSFNKTDLHFTYNNGSQLYLVGADNHDSLRGVSLTYAFIDEAKDITPETLYEVIMPALSDKQGGCLVTGTPGGVANWFYDLTKNPDFKHFHNTTLECGFVEPEEIERMRRMLDVKTFNQEFMSTFENSTSLVYYTFSDDNIRPVNYQSNLDTWISFDFNVSPMTASIIQKQDGLHCIVKEFYLKDSNTYETANKIKDFLGNLTGSLTITGDYSGNSRKSSSSYTDYQIIKNILGHYNKYKQVVRPTRSIRDRINSTNAMFRNSKNEISMVINPECVHTINDFRRVQYKNNSYELDGTNKDLTHCSDNVSYYCYNNSEFYKSPVTRMI